VRKPQSRARDGVKREYRRIRVREAYVWIVAHPNTVVHAGFLQGAHSTTAAGEKRQESSVEEATRVLERMRDGYYDLEEKVT